MSTKASSVTLTSLEKTAENVGTVACILAALFVISGVDQIRLNWSGEPGSFWQPFFLFLNCITWTFYGFFKQGRDWNIIIPNFIGIFISALNIATVVICSKGKSCGPDFFTKVLSWLPW